MISVLFSVKFVVLKGNGGSHESSYVLVRNEGSFVGVLGACTAFQVRLNLSSRFQGHSIKTTQ